MNQTSGDSKIEVDTVMIIPNEKIIDTNFRVEAAGKQNSDVFDLNFTDAKDGELKSNCIFRGENGEIIQFPPKSYINVKAIRELRNKKIISLQKKEPKVKKDTRTSESQENEK